MVKRDFELPIPIGEAAKTTGTSVKKLRYWQEKGLIIPMISKCGMREYRYYSADQIALIKRIKSFMDEGYNLMVAASKAIICQSALKIDPQSASNFDPPLVKKYSFS